MPEVPEYYSRGNIPAESMPRIPSDAGGQVGAALARGGAQMADMGFALEQRLKQQSQLEELTNNTIDARTKINDIHQDILNSPEFNTNPETARNEFDRRVNELRGQYQINDGRVAVEFKNHFENARFSALTAITNESRARAIDLGRAAADTDLVKLQNLAFNAQDERDYHQIAGMAKGRIMGMAAVGSYKAEDAVNKFQEWESTTAIGRAKRDMQIDPESTLSALAEKRGIYSRINEKDLTPLMDLAQKRVEHVQHQRRLETERQEREIQKQTVNTAYDELSTMFPGDYGRAVEYARDPRNYPGLDEERRKSLVGSLENAANWDRQKRDQNQKQTNNLVFDNFLKNPSGMTEATIIATDAGPEVKQHLLEIQRKNTEQRFRTDPAVEADVLSKIWSGKITDRSDLLAYIGNGLAADKAKELAGSIDQAQDPTKSKYFEMSDNLFSQKYKDDAEMLKMRSEFLFLLDQHVKRDNLKGPDIFKKAEELIKPLEETQFRKFLNSMSGWDFLVAPLAVKGIYYGLGGGEGTPVFQRQLEQKPWITVEEPPATPAAKPIVRPVPKPDTGRESQERAQPDTDYSISYDQRTAITGWLKQAGYPLTEANIQAMSKKLRQGE